MSRLLSLTALLVGFASVTACAPSSNGPVEIMTIDRQSSGGQFGPVAQTFNTLSNLTGLQGGAAKFVGGARIIYDPNDPLLGTGGALTDVEEQRIVLKQAGQDVRLNYTRRNGVYWPVDYQSWQMATTYWNMELAFTYFNQLGVFGSTDTSLTQPSVIPTLYYYPYFQNAVVGTVQEYDNTFYFPPVQGFVVEPNLYDADSTDPSAITTLPLSMNRGALAIEYSHWVFNQLVYQDPTRGGGTVINGTGISFPGCNTWGAPCPQSSTATPYPAYYFFEAWDQGLAFYHAFNSLCTDGTPDSQCGDTTYLAASLGPLATQNYDITNRNMCLTQALKDEWQQQATGNNFLQGDDKLVGAVIAAALYQAGDQTNQQGALQQAIISAYFDTNANPGLAQVYLNYQSAPSDLTYGTLANAIVEHIPDSAGSLHLALCGQLMDRLSLDGTTLPACADATSNATCAVLQ